MIDYSGVFFWIRIALGIVFVAAFFAMLYKALGWDLIGEWKKRTRKKESPELSESDEAYNEGFEAGMKKALDETNVAQVCEAINCVREASEHGALIQVQDVRRIVCDQCCGIYTKAGWKIIMKWGDEK